MDGRSDAVGMRRQQLGGGHAIDGWLWRWRQWRFVEGATAGSALEFGKTLLEIVDRRRWGGVNTGERGKIEADIISEQNKLHHLGKRASTHRLDKLVPNSGLCQDFSGKTISGRDAGMQ